MTCPAMATILSVAGGVVGGCEETNCRIELDASTRHCRYLTRSHVPTRRNLSTLHTLGLKAFLHRLLVGLNDLYFLILVFKVLKRYIMFSILIQHMEAEYFERRLRITIV